MTVTSLAPGGDGVAHAPIGEVRRAIFVPRAAPGERLRVEIDARRRPATARILEILEPGPDRVSPACAWAERCGGCDWMHLSPDRQANAHVEHVRAALPAAWRALPIREFRAPSALAYRTRARVHVRAPSHGGVRVGMHEAGTHHPVEVDACAVLDPVVERARARLVELLAGSRGEGEVQIARGILGRPVLEIRWTGELGLAAFGALEREVLSGAIAGARVTLAGAVRPARIGDPTPWMAGADGGPLRLAPGGFGQANEAVNAVLVHHVAECASAGRSETCVELFAGAGNLSVVLARAVDKLVCVESDRDACEAARLNLEARGVAARVVEAQAETYAWSTSTRLIVLDPPRGGARTVAERLAAAPVLRVIYVSCDPQTLARDLALLERAYVPSSIGAFEMFPQTSHIETVIALERRRR